MTEFTYVLMQKNGLKRIWVDPHSNSRLGRAFQHTPAPFQGPNGEWLIRLGKKGKRGAYSLKGHTFYYHYRLKRTLGLVQYTGHQKEWFEGNPTPFDPNDKAWRDALDGTAFIVGDVLDSDADTRLMQPRKMDWLVLILVAAIGVFGGIGIGQYLMRR